MWPVHCTGIGESSAVSDKDTSLIISFIFYKWNIIKFN